VKYTESLKQKKYTTEKSKFYTLTRTYGLNFAKIRPTRLD